MDNTPLRPERRFNEVGPGCDLVHCARRPQRDLNPYDYVELLFKTLEIGFRLAQPSRPQPVLHLNHTSHHDRMFEVAFSSDDDEVVSDAMCAWIADSGCSSAGSFACRFSGRMERATPFSPGLRQMGTRAVCRTSPSKFTMSALETVCLLNHLEADVGDAIGWVCLLVGVIRPPTGFESLSSHNWHLLGELMRIAEHSLRPLPSVLRDIEVARSLEETEDWEKLEVWLAAVWGSLLVFHIRMPELMEGIELVTLKLSLRQPSALQRFEDQCERLAIRNTECEAKLQEICSRARAERLPSEPSPPLCVSVPPVRYLSLLMPPFPSVNRSTPSH